MSLYEAPSNMPLGAPLLWEMSEADYGVNNYNGWGLAQPVRVRKLDPSLCLVSLHAVNHHRDGKIKPADICTGGLVRMLGAVAGVSSIINQSCDPAMEPQPYQYTPAELALERMLFRNPSLVVFDFHGAKDNDQFDIALGTGGTMSRAQERLTGLIADECSRAGLRCALNPEGYKAEKPTSLTYRARTMLELHSIVQIEIVRKLRQPNAQSAAPLLQMLGSVISRLRLS